MRATRRQLLLILVISFSYLLGQLFVGTNVVVAFLLTIAILFGLLAIFAGGGLQSAFGCLNAILISKFLLIGVAIKILVLEPADGTLYAPVTTSAVMALGFFGVFLGTTIQSLIPCPVRWSVNRPFSAQMLLSLSVVLFFCSYGGYIVSMIPSTQGAGIQTGGWVGITHVLGSLKSLSIVPPMLYLWRKKTRLWMSHPVILFLVIWSAAIGIFSTGKQEAIEPLVFYVLLGFLRYGWMDSRLWALVSLGALYYMVIIFPYSQYVRSAGGREGTFEERAQVTADTFWRIMSNEEFRTTVTDHVSKQYYFGPSLAAFSRLAMVGEADRLIYATERQQSFTGWETITWGFKLLTPSVLYPDKPIFEAANYLSHIAGESNITDTTTEVSYGMMANLYNAFSFTGVLIGTPVFFGLFYYWVRIFLGDASWSGLPSTSTLWFVWLVASYQHSLVESSLSGLIASISFPSVIVLLCILAKWLVPFFPADTPADSLDDLNSPVTEEAATSSNAQPLSLSGYYPS
jgi:hypothetical protein